ncbi:MAG TPA: hypothetical protein VMS43_06345 [Allosphingosinicella sp.]|nr:hypothetical protein [Allosphingosinicella sp.]
MRKAASITIISFFLFLGLVARRCFGHSFLLSDARANLGDEEQMVYFRAPSEAQCNVYMNYSFYEPHFTLVVRNSAALTPVQRRFVGLFSDAFQRQVGRALVNMCRVPPFASLLPRARARQLLNRCIQAVAALGIAERGWTAGRLPAPSNCISPELVSAGTVHLFPAQLPSTPMSIDRWMSRARGGR